MTRDEFVALLERMKAATDENRADDLAACFAEDVDYSDPLRYHFRSRAELREFIDLPEEKLQWVTWHTIVFDEASQTGAVEYSYNETHLYHGLVLVTVANGLVTRWREYQHISEHEFDAFVAGAARL